MATVLKRAKRRALKPAQNATPEGLCLETLARDLIPDGIGHSSDALKLAREIIVAEKMRRDAATT